MKNFVLLALTATVAFTAEEKIREIEPDLSEFPEDWTKSSCGTDQCKVSDESKSVDQVAVYDKELSSYYSRCKYDIYCRPQRSYCRMQANPEYPTSNPYGYFHLWEFYPGSNLFIWGYMNNLPHPSPSRHGFSIHEYNWNGKACCSAGRQLQTSSQKHWWPTNSNAHTGQLWPLYENSGFAWTFQNVPKPTLYGSQSVNYKTMVVYEDGDDYGFGNTWHSWEYGSGGQRVACCTIRPYYIYWDQVKEVDTIDVIDRHRRQLSEEMGEDVDIFTPEQYRELFGHEPEKFAFEENLFNQN